MVRGPRAVFGTAGPANKSRIPTRKDFDPLLLYERCRTRGMPRAGGRARSRRQVTIPSGMSFFHFAFELEGNRFEDVVRLRGAGKESGLLAQLWPGAPQWRAASRRRRNRRKCRLLFLRSRLLQCGILRRHGHDRELPGPLRRRQGICAGLARVRLHRFPPVTSVRAQTSALS